MKKIIRNLIVTSFICLTLGLLTSCKTPEITLSVEDLTLELGEVYKLSDLNVNIDDEELKNTINYSDYNTEIINIVDGQIFAEEIGKTSIKVTVASDEVVAKKINITVVDLENFYIDGPTSLTIGEKAEYKVYPEGLEVKIVSSDEEKLRINDGHALATEKGKVTLIAEYKGSKRKLNVEITKDDVAPTITNSGEEEITISWNSDFDIFEGIKATDNIDGELEVTLKENFDKEKMGTQKITYVAVDSSGNEVTLKRTINVVWDYSVEFIGHAGSYYGVMNSEEAILYAIQVLKYQCVEIDLKQTGDGQFVLCHDDTFAGYPLAFTTWSVLKDVTYTTQRCSGFPAENGSVKKKSYTAGLCTLERYLEICKEYNVKAVIELKSSKGISNNDTSRMQALMDIIEKYKMRNNVIFLTSSYNCLIWTRENGYSDIPCQYLVNSCESEEILNRCIQYNLDISVNATGTNIQNSQEWLDKYHEAGLKISCYTFTQYSDYNTLQKWIDKGVDYVTCDWHLMSKVKLPKEEK